MKQLLFGMILLIFMASPLPAATVTGDINNDGKVALEEAIYALQCIAGIKTNIPTQQEIKALEKVINYDAVSAADMVDMVSANEIMFSLGFSNISGDNAVEIAQTLVAGEFDCGTMDRNLSTVTYTFNGNENCGGVTGTIVVQPQYSEGQVSFSVEYINVVKDQCTINGTGTTTATLDESNVVITHVSDNMTVCGQQMNGTTTVTLNALTGTLVSAHVQGTYTYDNGLVVTTITVNLTYDGTTGKLSGTAEITMGDATYNCTLTDVIIDPTCGVPTAGTITIDEHTFDFSETTCENPTVTTTIHGIPVTLELDEAMAIYQST